MGIDPAAPARAADQNSCQCGAAVPPVFLHL